jgi:hypothetical protein
LAAGAISVAAQLGAPVVDASWFDKRANKRRCGFGEVTPWVITLVCEATVTIAGAGKTMVRLQRHSKWRFVPKRDTFCPLK